MKLLVVRRQAQPTDQFLQLLGALLSELAQLLDPVQPVSGGICRRRFHFTTSDGITAAACCSRFVVEMNAHIDDVKRGGRYGRTDATQVNVEHVKQKK